MVYIYFTYSLYSIAIFIVIFVVCSLIKELKQSNYVTKKTLNMYFTNVQRIYSPSNMFFYKGDKLGENFLIAIKSSSSFFSNLDFSTINDVSEKNHLHNKILIINGTMNISPSQVKKLKESGVQIYNNVDFKSLISNVNSNSILKTSDTSDDNCNIDEPINPIKNEDRSILSLFRNKPDRL